jgi:hypothetical protein
VVRRELARHAGEPLDHDASEWACGTERRRVRLALEPGELGSFGRHVSIVPGVDRARHLRCAASGTPAREREARRPMMSPQEREKRKRREIARQQLWLRAKIVQAIRTASLVRADGSRRKMTREELPFFLLGYLEHAAGWDEGTIDRLLEEHAPPDPAPKPEPEPEREA